MPLSAQICLLLLALAQLCLLLRPGHGQLPATLALFSLISAGLADARMRIEIEVTARKGRCAAHPAGQRS